MQTHANLSRATLKSLSQSKGFGIVEAIVSASILFTAVAISLSLYTFSASNARRVEVSQSEADAINEDLSVILLTNDKYACTSASMASCTASQGEAYPDEDSYLPSGYTTNQALRSTWINACNDGLGDELAAAVGKIPQADLNDLNITRTAEKIKSASDPNMSGHLYRVKWIKSGLTIRSLVLYPNIAAWCP